jgi:hypothetical protein
VRKTFRWLVISLIGIFFGSGLLFSSYTFGEEKDLMSLALGELSIQKADFRFTDNGIDRTYGKDPFRLPFFNNQLKNPLGTPSFLRSTSSYLGTHPSLRDLLWMGSYRLGYLISAYPQYEPDLSYRIVESAPLLYAISEIYAVHGKPMQSGTFQYVKKQAEKVPLDLQKQLAMILYASIEFKGYRDSAFQGIPELDLIKAFRNPSAILTDELFDTTTYNIAGKMNYGSLFFGGLLLGKTIDQSMEEIKKLAIPSDISFDFNTPMGRIILNGENDNTYTEKEILLSLDSGGNDHYINGGGGCGSYFNPVSVVLDCGGNDSYETTDDSIYSQGAGVFGMGVLVDLSGDDTYQAKCYAQGFSAFGIGILDDRGGKDSYVSKILSMGSSMFGISYLQDREGSDKYDMYSYGQGFGYVRGFGCLLDSKGDDIYIANDSDVAGDNPQSSDHNTSFCQGAGFGRRADLAEGNSISGGIGILVDMEGDDQYSCGVFGQGTGYWAGTGYLYDGQGNDSYKGVWYVQGGAAHFGIGALFDDGGSDNYNALLNMAQGAGHDLSLGFLIDKSGNDTYTSPNLALGGGNDNGIGIFVDGEGDDLYQLRSAGAVNLGKANYSTALFGSWRDTEFCVGIFIDHAGKDSYKILDKDGKPGIDDTRAKENSIWTYYQDKAPKSMGCGIDSEDGTLPGLVP